VEVCCENGVEKKGGWVMPPSDQKGTGISPDQERYRPIAKLGSGGMADVFLGVQLGEQGFERLLVIKKIHARGLKNDSAIQMFIDEARCIASLNHPHIVKVYDLSRVRDQICITMEYIDGENLDYMLRALKNAKKIFPLPIVCKLMIEACEALHYAHTVKSPDGTPLNLVHRDIGAQNLMIDSQGYLKVIDFGIAKSTVQTEFTLPGLIKGKLSYLAPDVFKFKDIDGRVDLYALGLVLYELVTMQRPFSFSSETSMAEILNSILQDSIHPPTEINHSIPPDLEKVIFKATDKDRNRRYQTGEEFAQALYDFANKHEGIATTLEVKNWYQTEFKQRIEQRHKFEQQVQEKANRIKKKTTNSGIIALPPTLDSEERKEKITPTPEQQVLPVQPAGPIITPKHTNPYFLLTLAFLLFIGGMIVVHQLFLKSNQSEQEITLAPTPVQTQKSQLPTQTKPTPPPENKPKPLPSSSAPASDVAAPTPNSSASNVPALPAQPPPPAPTNPTAKESTEEKTKPETTADNDANVILVDKPTVPSKAVAVPPKAAVEPHKAPAAVAKKPAYQPLPRRRPAIRTNDTTSETDEAGLSSGEKPEVETQSGTTNLVSAPVTSPPPTASEKAASDSTVAMAEMPKIDKLVTPKPPSNQSVSEPKKPAAVATINLLSGNGNWTGDQTAKVGCTHCHPIDWNKKTKSQWQYFITRGLHNRHRDLKLYFSEGELSRLINSISAKEKEFKKPKGIAGTN
jgi:serine/threonine protein kinase